jgi:hypothetical protein
MKPLMRWTIGPAHDSGFQILRHSVRQAQRLYGDAFRYAICYNGLNQQQLESVQSLGCECVDQKSWAHSLDIPPPGPDSKGGPAWKLYPPRLSLDTHEIVIDNDLVLSVRLDVIDQFLKDDSRILLTRAVRGGRGYGAFDEYVRRDYTINTGLMAFPPGFDLAATLNLALELCEVREWRKHFDEQGLIAMVTQDLNTVVIDGIRVCWTERSYKRSPHGMHFVGANKGDDVYWRRYSTVV